MASFLAFPRMEEPDPREIQEGQVMTGSEDLKGTREELGMTADLAFLARMVP